MVARQGVREGAERARKAAARAFDAAERATRLLEQVTAAAIFVRRIVLRRRLAAAVSSEAERDMVTLPTDAGATGSEAIANEPSAEAAREQDARERRAYPA